MEIQLLFLQERLPISLNFEKKAFRNSKTPNPNRQLKCINICKLIKNVVFGYKKNNNTTKMCILHSNIAPKQIEAQCSLLYHQKITFNLR